jgi:uncharacterized protein
VPLLAYAFQERLLFFPQALSEARRADVRQRYPSVEEVFIESEQHKLHAWHVKAGPDAPLVVYFGGNAEEVSWMVEASAQVPGVSWLLTDYRGYGLSGGAPGEAALVADALAWYDKFAPSAKRVFVFGRSLGSGVAVQLAAARPVQAVVLVTPYDSIAAVAKRHYWYLPVDLLLKHRFDSIARAPAMKTPLLCVVAGEDAVIPPDHAERLFAAWGGPKRKVLLQAAGHNTTDEHPLFWPAVREFLSQPLH